MRVGPALYEAAAKNICSRFDLALAEVYLDDMPQILHTSVDVVLEQVNILDVNRGGASCGRLDLHDTDSPCATPAVLHEAGFLVCDCCEENVVEVVLLTVLPEEREHLLQPLPILAGGGILCPSVVAKIALEENVGEECTHPVSRNVAVQGFLQLRVVFSDGGSNGASGVEDDLGVYNHAVKHTAPELGDVVVCDGHLDDPGVHHLENVFGFQALVRFTEHDRREIPLAEGIVQNLEMFEVAAGLPDVDFPSRKIFECGE